MNIYETVSCLNKSFPNSIFWHASDLASRRLTGKQSPKFNRFNNFWVLIRLIVRKFSLRSKTRNCDNVDYIIITYFDKRINDQDPYFHNLKKELDKREKSYLTVGVTVGDRKQVGKTIRLNKSFVSVESYLSLFSVIKVFFYILIMKIHFFDDVDDQSIKKTLMEKYYNEFNKGSIFRTACLYFAFKKLLSINPEAKVIWPWENQRWERLLVLARNDVQSKNFLIGYQHATLLLSWPQLFPAEIESNYLPLPDRIVTSGVNAQKVLEQNSTFPNHCELKVGCSLRFEVVSKKSNFNFQKTIGIGLGIDPTLSIKTLDRVFSQIKDSSTKILIRCHPVLPRSEIEKLVVLPKNASFHESTIDEFFNQISFLAYCGTGICMDGLSAGKFLVYIDLENSNNNDPLYLSPHFKIVNSLNESLESQISEVLKQSQDKLRSSYKEAIFYLEGYYAKISDETIKAFF